MMGEIASSPSELSGGHKPDDRYEKVLAMARQRVKASVEPGSVRLGPTEITFDIHRSFRRKKTVEISVRDGRVRVAAPADTPRMELDRIVLKRAEWILGRLAEAVDDMLPPRLAAGTTVPLLGENVPLRLETADVPRSAVKLHNGVLRVGLPSRMGGQEAMASAEEALIRWYRAEAAEHLPAVVDRWWPALGRGEKCQVLVRNQKRRWGSCSAGGTIRLNWRLMMLEPDLVDLVVVHELAHLTVMNHSSEFWSLVAKHIPDLKACRKRLRESEAALPW